MADSFWDNWNKKYKPTSQPTATKEVPLKVVTSTPDTKITVVPKSAFYGPIAPLPALKVVQAGQSGQVLPSVKVISSQPQNYAEKSVEPLTVKPLPQQPAVIPGGKSLLQSPNVVPQTPAATPQSLKPTVTAAQLPELRNQPLTVTGVNGTPAPKPLTPEQQKAVDVAEFTNTPTSELLKQKYGNNIKTKIAGFLFDLTDPVTKTLSTTRISNKIQSEVAAGRIDPIVYSLMQDLNKSGLQVLGDATQVGILMTPVGFTRMAGVEGGKVLVQQGLKKGLVELAKIGLKENALQGLALGVGQALSSGSTNATEIAKIIAASTATNAAAGAVLTPGLPLAGKATKAFANKTVRVVGDIVAETNKILNQRVDELVSAGITRAEAKKLVGQAGFFGRMNPRVAALEQRWDDLQLAKSNAPSKGAVSRIEKAQKVIERQIQKENQAGFVGKSPFEEESSKLLRETDGVIAKKESPQKVPIPKPKSAELPQIESPKGSQILEKSSSGSSIPENKLFYNYDKLNIPEPAKAKLKQEILKVEKKTEKLLGKKLTHEEWLSRANKIREGLGKTMTKKEQADWIARNYNSQRKLAELGKQMESGEKVSFEKLKNIFSEAKSGATFAGRLLESMKEVRDPISVALLKEMEKAGKLSDDILKKASTIDWADEKMVSEFFRREVKAGIEEWIDLLRYNSMLSSPNTWLVNVSGGIQSLVVQPLVKTVTGMFDFVGTLGGTVRPRSAYAGEGLKYVGGVFKEAGTKFSNLVKKITGKQLPELTKIIDPEYAQRVPLTKPGTGGRLIERALDWPGRIMQATDEFIASFAKAGESSALEYRASKGIPLTADEITERAGEATRYALFRQGHAKEGKILGAIQHVSDVLNELRKHENPALRIPAKFTFPFVNIATQITKQGIEFSPLGISTLWGAANKTEQLAKAAIGTTTATLIATLLGSDRLTFGRPIGKNQQKAFDDAGMKPYSVKIGNKWIPYSKLHPAFAFNFALVAGIKQAQEEGRLGEDKGEIILNSFARSFNFIADQSYLRNVGDFVAATKGDASGMARYLSNYPAQLVPYRAMLSYINRLIDTTEKEVDPDAGLIEKQMQYIQRQIPGLSSKLPAKTNKDGEPITDDNPWLNALSPFGRIGTTKPEAEGYYKNLQSMSRMDREKEQMTADAKKPVQDVYARAQKLKAEGKVDEATKMVRALTPEQQKIYKEIKSAEKTKNTIETEVKILEIYKKAQQLKAEGKVDEATKMVRALSPAEQKAYNLLKERYKNLN